MWLDIPPRSAVSFLAEDPEENPSKMTLNLAARVLLGLLVAAPSVLAPAGYAGAGEATVEEALHLAGEARYDEAESILAGHALRPGGERAALELARLRERLGENEAAAEMYERAIAGFGPDDPERRRLEERIDRCRRRRASTTRFPVSLEASARIREVEALLEGHRWDAGFASLAGVLGEYEGTFLQSSSAQGSRAEYRSLREWARSLVDGLPEDGRAAYLAAARTAWRDALASGTEASSRRFLERFPGSATGGPALLSWADSLADAGEIERALGLIERPEVDRASAGPRAERWRARLEEGAGSAAGAAGGVPGADPSKDLLDALKGGWSFPLRDGEDPCSFGLAAFGGRFFLAGRSRVEARDLRTGASLWTHVPEGPPGRRDIPRPAYSHRRFPRRKWAGRLDPPGVAAGPRCVVHVDAYDLGDAESAFSVLTGLHPETGAVLWRVPGEGDRGRLLIAGDPLLSGGTVLAAAATAAEDPEVHLLALDAGDGSLLWRRRVAMAAVPAQLLGRGSLAAGQSGPSLACGGEVVYFATHMGSVVALDRDLGLPIWALPYPRATRFGPLVDAPIALADRRTEPVLVTSRRLVLLPRDLNGLLSIDRRSGKLERMIRSLDLMELVDASETRAWVRTLSGEIRSYSLEDGAAVWSFRPPKMEGAGRPLRIGAEILAPCGTSMARLDADTGERRGEVPGEAPLEIRRIGSPSAWAAICSGEIRVLGAGTVPGTVPSGRPGRAGREGEEAPPALRIARARSARPGGGPRPVAFVAGRSAEARLVRAGGRVLLAVAGGGGISVLDPEKGFERLWWRPFDGEAEAWAVPEASGDPSAPSLLVHTRDREKLILLDPLTGREIAVGSVDDLSPIRSLFVMGEQVVVAATSSLAAVRRGDAAAGPARPGTGPFRPSWRLDVSPRTFAGILPARPLIVLVQASDAEPARLLKLDPASGEIVGSVPLGPASLRLLGWLPGFAVLEAAESWGLLDLGSGRVTLLANVEAAKTGAPASEEERILADWLKEHPGHGRGQTPPFRFRGGGLRYSEGAGPTLPDGARAALGFLEDATGRRIPLGGIETRRIDVLGPFVVSSGARGILVLRDGGPAAGMPPDLPAGIGKDPGDLVDPPAVRNSPAAGLVLDGDLSEWPADGRQALAGDRHAWPSGIDRAAGDDPGISAMFQVAADGRGVWIAVRVDPARGKESGEARGMPRDRIEVLLAADGEGGRLPLLVVVSWRKTFPALTLRLADGRSVAGRVAGIEDLAGEGEGGSEDAALAVGSSGESSTYEMMIDRKIFAGGGPRGFDIRVARDRGSGIRTWLEWGGALGEPGAGPPASIEEGPGRRG
jgi:outer membrane protein assembly factor BamB